jgi:hypothetical protein
MRSTARCMAIIFILFGLQGCAPLVKPLQLWGLDGLLNAFAPGASGRDLASWRGAVGRHPKLLSSTQPGRQFNNG